MTLVDLSVDDVSLIVDGFEGDFSPRILSMEKFNGEDFFVEGPEERVLSESTEREQSNEIFSTSISTVAVARRLVAIGRERFAGVWE